MTKTNSTISTDGFNYTIIINFCGGCYADFYDLSGSLIQCDSDIVNPCDDLQGVSFGMCDMVLGVAVVNGEATLKKYYLGEKGVELHPRNEHYNIIHVSEDDELYIQGQVLGVFREYN